MLDSSLPGRATSGSSGVSQSRLGAGWMRCLPLIAAMTAVFAAPAAAEPPSKTGYTLELWCMSDRQEDRIACWHYLTGVGDGLTAARAFGKSTLCFDTTRPVSP